MQAEKMEGFVAVRLLHREDGKAVVSSATVMTPELATTNGCERMTLRPIARYGTARKIRLLHAPHSAAPSLIALNKASLSHR
jgi:hypothetical protein